MSTRRAPAAGPRLSRRALTSGSLATGTLGLTGLLSGCDGNEVVDLPGLPPIGDDPDRDLLLAALADERMLVERIRRTRRRHRPLRRPLAAALQVHQAHVDLLAGASPDAEEAEDTEPAGPGSRNPGAVPADPRGALTAILRRETRLAEKHVATAMAAESGTFARLVASMSAAAAQQAAALAEARTGLRGAS